MQESNKIFKKEATPYGQLFAPVFSPHFTTVPEQVLTLEQFRTTVLQELLRTGFL